MLCEASRDRRQDIVFWVRGRVFRSTWDLGMSAPGGRAEKKSARALSWDLSPPKAPAQQAELSPPLLHQKFILLIVAVQNHGGVHNFRVLPDGYVSVPIHTPPSIKEKTRKLFFRSLR